MTRFIPARVALSHHLRRSVGRDPYKNANLETDRL